MKRIFSSSFVPLVAGLFLRLFFVLRLPAASGDAVLYEQMADNWLHRHAYAMEVFGQVTPVDLRMPGYPAFLAVIYALTGRTGDGAHVAVMLAQIPVDLLTCLLAAFLASTLLLIVDERANPRPVFLAALWLTALCPFTANYTAVPLTEVFATFFTTAALLPLCLLVTRVRNNGWFLVKQFWPRANDYRYLAALAGLLVGLCTLFRPESPLLLVAATLVLVFILFLQREVSRLAIAALVMAVFCLAPLVPWTIRNAVTLHEFQPLAPKNSNLPGELIPYGFMSWEKTWLYRFREVYLVPWKLNGESINIDDLPARAFDTPEERARVASILQPYNEDLTLTAEEDAAFARLARERTARHPLRTYLWLPAARAVTLWFTPRIELIPVSGAVFPLVQSWQDDKLDQSVTVLFFFLNIAYLALALVGARRLWRNSPAVRSALCLLAAFLIIRTAFLTTLETPEPRYVLVCYPALLALAAFAFRRPPAPSPPSLPAR